MTKVAAMHPARGQRLGQLRPVIALAALDLDVLADELPGAAVEVIADRLALRLQAEPAGPRRWVLTRKDATNRPAAMVPPRSSCTHERRSRRNTIMGSDVSPITSTLDAQTRASG
jgi:hypothetical protein